MEKKVNHNQNSSSNVPTDVLERMQGKRNWNEMVVTVA